jgi:LTXXQ motif family protein
MKRLIIAAATVAVLALSPLAVGAFAAADDSQEHGRHHWMEERAALLDARLAGFKAALKLNGDQEKSWSLFENAVRDAAKARAENMRAMRERREGDEQPSPIDRMRMMSDRLAKRSAAVKTLADAATPLYVSLDDGQKRDFGFLFRDLLHRGRHHLG